VKSLTEGPTAKYRELIKPAILASSLYELHFEDKTDSIFFLAFSILRGGISK
jgi:hypothetical protein